MNLWYLTTITFPLNATSASSSSWHVIKIEIVRWLIENQDVAAGLQSPSPATRGCVHRRAESINLRSPNCFFLGKNKIWRR